MRGRSVILAASLLPAAFFLTTSRPAQGVTDDDVQRAIQRGREYLLNLRNPDGSFTADPRWRSCYSALVLMTLAYMGENPNQEVMARGINYLVSLDADRDFYGREGYALPIRVMAVAYLYQKLSDDKKAVARQQMLADLNHIIAGQSGVGGWRYQFNRADYDFSVTQWPLLAIYEAGRLGVEFPKEPLLAARAFYFRGQRDDGGWSYQFSGKSYGSMTAAGLASLYTISDLVEPASGCPCKNGRSQASSSETERRMEAALAWLARNFTVSRNPAWPHETNFDEVYYWLYSVERVAIATGYKHFGRHNWYAEGAEFLVSKQLPNGSWEQIDPKVRTDIQHWGGGRVPDTCFAILFLYKGRAPVLFNKLRFDGTWNAHRRDLANLTRFIEWAKEQQFHWQVVDLAAPLDELHDAPILYISAETPPNWGDAEKKKLRAFTDTGGTILIEASCGNPQVREWFHRLAKEVWPEWPLQNLGPEHPVFTDPYRLTQRPELMGISDGIRTFLYYAMDDISCPWHMKAYGAKEYLFRWGINLFTCATDHSPLRARLAGAEPPPANRFREPVRAGARRVLRMARVRHSGNWEAGANYAALTRLAEHLRATAGVMLHVKESDVPPVTEVGVPAENLSYFDAAYLTGSRAFSMSDADKGHLKAFADRGGFLWAEAAAGSAEFDTSLRALVSDLGWGLRLLPPDHPLMTGRMDPARGYDLRSDMEFRRALRVARAGKPWAEFWGIFAGQRLVGVYSPLDVTWSTLGYQAYNCRGYKPADALAVATNVVLCLTSPRTAGSSGDSAAEAAAAPPRPALPAPPNPPQPPAPKG